MRSKCRDCDGSGETFTPRLAIILAGDTLDEALADPDRIGVGAETRPCENCSGRGWVAGFDVPA